jgi:hypothetical protein
MSDDQAGPNPPPELPAQSPGQQPGASAADDPGYLIETGEAVAEDGSVAPIIGGLPAVEGSSWDIGAPAEDRGVNLAESQERWPDESGQGSTPGN